ncbi:MAG: hypothetical protein IJM97_00360, partial [Clostridia bacterium]|nr:hypothetical protein [Clostridia bacterium]
YTATLKFGETYSVTSPEVLGYVADRLVVDGTMPAENVTEKVVYTPRDDTKYTVIHYTENLDGTWKIEVTEVLAGTTNTTATAVPKEFKGFTFDETLGKLTGNIEPDGSLVLEVYYTRNTYTITYTVDGKVYDKKEYKFGDTILPIIPPRKGGYEFVKWENLPEIMPAEDITVPAVFKPIPSTPVVDETPTPDDPYIPQTGVELNLTMYLVIFLFASLVMFVLIRRRPENS